MQVDCAVGAWGGWSACAAATGRKRRTREVVTWPSSDGRACPALDDATDCLAELHDAAKDGDLAAVKARLRSQITSVPARDAIALQSLLAAGAAVDESSFG